MQGLQSLRTLLDHEEEQRDQALLAAQQAQAQEQAALTQAEQLLAYRDEYQQRWSSQFSQGGTMQLMHCYQGFMARLDLAIGQQQRVVDQARTRAGRCRDTLRGLEQRVAAVRKLMGRRIDEHQRGVARRDQKQTDEAASRAAGHDRGAWNRPTASS
jgi:flagellar FliJ protein